MDQIRLDLTKHVSVHLTIGYVRRSDLHLHFTLVLRNGERPRVDIYAFNPRNRKRDGVEQRLDEDAYDRFKRCLESNSKVLHKSQEFDRTDSSAKVYVHPHYSSGEFFFEFPLKNARGVLPTLTISEFRKLGFTFDLDDETRSNINALIPGIDRVKANLETPRALFPLLFTSLDSFVAEEQNVGR